MENVFIQRDGSENIVGVFSAAQSFAQESITASDPSVTAFLASLVPPPTLTFLQFMALFTAPEQAAMVNSADTQTKLFVLMATGSGGIQLGNPEVVAGINYLATPTTATPPGPGILTVARAAQVLAGTTPPAN
jgi:hypothetical protein